MITTRTTLEAVLTGKVPHGVLYKRRMGTHVSDEAVVFLLANGAWKEGSTEQGRGINKVILRGLIALYEKEGGDARVLLSEIQKDNNERDYELILNEIAKHQKKNEEKWEGKKF